jgi:ketosteroid isomerase-like protein
MKADAETEAAALEILESFCSAFAHRDVEAVMSLFAEDPDIVVVTSEESLLRGHDEVSSFLIGYAEGSTTYSWEWERIEVSSVGPVAWLLAEGTERAVGEEAEERHPYRMTMVCALRDDRCLLMQVHGSSPHGPNSA